MSAFFNKEYELFYDTISFLISYHQNNRMVKICEKEIEEFTIENNKKRIAIAKEDHAFFIRKRNSDFETYLSKKERLKSKARKHIVKTVLDVDTLIRL